MELYTKDMRAQCPIDSIANSVLDCLEDRISARLLSDIRENLRGFTEDMQLEIADDLLDCACQKSIHYTGIKHIDRMLEAYYLLICEETGYPTAQLLEDHQQKSINPINN